MDLAQKAFCGYMLLCESSTTVCPGKGFDAV